MKLDEFVKKVKENNNEIVECNFVIPAYSKNIVPIYHIVQVNEITYSHITNEVTYISYWNRSCSSYIKGANYKTLPDIIFTEDEKCVAWFFTIEEMQEEFTKYNEARAKALPLDLSIEIKTRINNEIKGNNGYETMIPKLLNDYYVKLKYVNDFMKISPSKVKNTIIEMKTLLEAINDMLIEVCNITLCIANEENKNYNLVIEEEEDW